MLNGVDKLAKQLKYTWKKDDPDIISRRFNGSCSLSVKKINLCLNRLVDEIFHPHMHAHKWGHIASVPRLQIVCVSLAELFRMRTEKV